MKDRNYAIEIDNLNYRYGSAEAVRGLSLKVKRGCCYALLGRNGAGKTTTMKCLLNLLRPKSGSVRVFGLDPRKQEVEVKRRLAYVPDQAGFYPWMSVRETLDYFASFREHWDSDIESDLLRRFHLDARQRAGGLSKGQRTQLALIIAVCPETELLILDEPTSGLDPIVRREFIETVIGAYQDGDPANRTVFVSTHLIAEFEGLIDEFTIMDHGRAALSLEADQARQRYQKILASFSEIPADLDLRRALRVRRSGNALELIANGGGPQLLEDLRARNPKELTVESLSLEEIFIASLREEPVSV